MTAVGFTKKVLGDVIDFANGKSIKPGGVGVYLDCITSREDCKNLVAGPVRGSIEYDPKCIDRIIDYCGGNPFYMHLFCSEVFKVWVQEQRTYLSETDFFRLQQGLVRSIGETIHNVVSPQQPRSGAASRAGRNAKAFRSKEEADLWRHV